MVELPAVVAANWAASIACRLRVVNLSAPNWLTFPPESIGDPSWRVTHYNAPEVESIPLNFANLKDSFPRRVRPSQGVENRHGRSRHRRE